MNFIDNIEIKNFKSIRHQKIEGCKRINVFIGYPNVGKSNILEALSGFSLLNKKSFQGNSLKSLIRFSRLSDIFFNADTQNPATIAFNKEGDIIVYSLYDFENLKLSILGWGEITRKPDSTIGRKKGETFLTALIDRSGSIKYSEGFDIEHTGKILAKTYSFNSTIQFQSSTSLNLNIPFGENLSDIVEISPSLRKECNEMLKEYNLNLHFDRSTTANKLEIRKSLPDGTTITLDWNLIADTLRRLFFYKAAIASNQNSVLLFEEPEAHMFPPYIKKLTTDILFDKTNQFFLATHSPYVLDELILEAGDDLSVYLVDYKDGETIVHHLSKDDLSEIREYGVDLFFNIESYLKNGQINNP